MPYILVATPDALRGAGIEAVIGASTVAQACEFVTSREELASRLRDIAGCSMLAIDLDFDEAGIFELMARARLRKPDFRILAFDMRQGASRAVRALRCGALGVVGAGAGREQLAQAVEAVAAGRRFVEGDAIGAVLNMAIDAGEAPRHEALSNREFETLCLFAAGLRLVDIASKLAISVKTVSSYRARLLEKLGVRTNAELIRYALDHELAK